MRLTVNKKMTLNKKFFLSHSVDDLVSKIKNEVSIIDNNENYNPDYNHLMSKYNKVYTFDICHSFNKQERVKILNNLDNYFKDRLVVFDIDRIIDNRDGILLFDGSNSKHISGTNIKYGIQHNDYVYQLLRESFHKLSTKLKNIPTPQKY